MTAHKVVATVIDTAGAHVTVDTGQTVTMPVAQYDAWQQAISAAKTQPNALAQPNQTITGSCGSSTLTFVPVGNHQGIMSTSFHVNVAAVEYQWWVSFVDNAGATVQKRAGTLAARTTWAWNPPFTFTGSGGPTRATVEADNSWALLIIGSLCFSGGPSESAIIT